MQAVTSSTSRVERVGAAVIGGGPAGLAAAEILTALGIRTIVFDAMPTVGRKFLMAGKSGLNLTKNAPEDAFRAAFACAPIEPMLRRFGVAATMAWAEDLGERLFTGSSGRVFPQAMKASPLLRRWLARMSAQGVELRTRWRWRGWCEGELLFDTPDGPREVSADATVLALGGGSWPRLGSDGAWCETLAREGCNVSPLRPANMGFDVAWSALFATRFAGHPVKPVALSLNGTTRHGEFVISKAGVEGSLIYALSAALRDALAGGDADLRLDLCPDRSLADLTDRLSRPRKKQSLANHLRRSIGVSGVRAGLLRELAPSLPDAPGDLAQRIKSLPLPVLRPRPLSEAISSAGGLSWSALDESLMLRDRPGLFAAGEMLDWEAPTGGYLLTGCLATGRWAGQAAADWLGKRAQSR
ncbi:MAG: TIGR03862 family flavoprotein [Pseudomonadota bacterium]